MFKGVFTFATLLSAFACVVTGGWLATLFLFPSAWQDHHGYNQLFWAIIASGSHLLVGILLLLTCVFEVSHRPLVVLMICTPILHLVGSTVGNSWYGVFFVVPSGAILLAACCAIYTNCFPKEIELRRESNAWWQS